MAFWKKIQMKINKKWYPKSVLVGTPVSTEQLCKRIGAESTVSPADVRAVFTALAPIMADYMSQGRSVKLDGIGSFYFTAVSAKGGVDAAEKVSANQIVGVRVRFNPETRFTKNGSGTGKHATRGLTDTPIEWEEWKGEEKKKKKKKEEGGIGQHGN
ncbi:HU family DNA-binding protein [Segatella maculosa]|uniref:HU family DNA-binding protein n=2 Tax=Segatella maculosa TaxID=439703 RepID=UPI00037E1401|nr:HU family DNA-binding protein [Segatella maculosa]